MNSSVPKSTHLRNLSMYDYGYKEFAALCYHHLITNDGDKQLSDEGIDHFVSSMEIGKEKKKMVKKTLLEIQNDCTITCRDERVFEQVFKLLIKCIHENWDEDSINAFYHKELEEIIEEAKNGKCTEQELLNASENIKQRLINVRDELSTHCSCGKMLVSFQTEFFAIIILPSSVTFK
jgi:hypothetical protein